MTFQFFNFFVWLRITDEGSVPEMRIWSILLIKSDLKWCIYLSRSLFLYEQCKLSQLKGIYSAMSVTHISDNDCTLRYPSVVPRVSGITSVLCTPRLLLCVLSPHRGPPLSFIMINGASDLHFITADHIHIIYNLSSTYFTYKV